MNINPVFWIGLEQRSWSLFKVTLSGVLSGALAEINFAPRLPFGTAQV